MTAAKAGLLMLMNHLRRKCTDANLKKKILPSVQAALTTMTCFAELTAMTAASPGQQMTQGSGTQTTLSAASRLKRSEKLSLEIAAQLLTVENVARTAVNATCLGKLQTLQEQLPIADARDPGENEHNSVY